MCGIGGWLGYFSRGETVPEQALHHRGPDAHGIKLWPEATLVHTRLSIIDISPAGQQPMDHLDDL
jgi:asparagine synthase (glutamine-hydrolysing)